MQLWEWKWTVAVWATDEIKFIINKENGRPFRGRTPWDITIETDDSKLSVFPNRMYEFSNGEREIKITGKKTGTTELKIKLWEIVIDTFTIRVYDKKEKIVPKTWSVLSAKKIAFGEEKTGFVVMKDNNYKNILNLKYDWKYTLSSSTDTKFCLKRTNLENIVQSLSKPCNARDFKSEITFDYDDTTVWILVFDYKVSEKNANMQLRKFWEKKVLSTKKLSVANDVWIKKDYEYKKEVNRLLEKWIVDGVRQWKFLEERQLYEADAYKWIKNTLIELRYSTNDQKKIQEINKRLEEIDAKQWWKFSDMTRKEFLSLATNYLVFSDLEAQIKIKYKDLDPVWNKKANLVFDEDHTWKDKFGQNYYQPDLLIKRWEWAYLISRVLDKQTSQYISLQ